MKKLISFLLLGLLVFVGCSNENVHKQTLTDWMEPNGRLKVLSTTAMIGDLVSQIGGDHIAPLCLIVGDLDPHSYELVKGDDEKIQAADLIFYNGLGLEHGASVRYHLAMQPQAISLGEAVYERFPSRFIFVEGQLDPHFWMDVDLFSETVDPIVEALSQKAPSHRNYFELRGQKLKTELKAKDRELRQKMETVPPEKRFLVTSHDAFHYFTKRYLALKNEASWQERVQAPEGLAPDGQMSVLDIQKVSDYLCQRQVRVVFPESNVSPDSLKKIATVCQKRGLEIRVAQTLLYGDTMAGAGSYIEMIQHNVNTLSRHLNEE